MKWFCVAVLVMFVTAGNVWGQLSEPCAWTPCGGEADCEKNGVSRTVGPFYSSRFPSCPWFVTIKEITCRNDEGFLEKSVCEILPSFESGKAGCKEMRDALDTRPYYNTELASQLMGEIYDKLILDDAKQEYQRATEGAKKYLECPYGTTRYTLVAASCSYVAPFVGTIKLGPATTYGDIGGGQGGGVYTENMLVSVEGFRWVPCNGVHCCRKHTSICWDKGKGKAVVKDVSYVSNNAPGTCLSEWVNSQSQIQPPPLPPGLKYTLIGYLQQCKPNCDNIFKQ